MEDKIMNLINKSYQDKVWIQCEYENCLKWRILTSEDASVVDSNEPWYCNMNPNSSFSSCSVPEERYPEESAFHRYGLKLVYSQLPLGSLVLVKMSGWPSWPSILCPDPYTGEYVNYDEDGDAEGYHVEFLGNPHTRTWISIRHIEPYQPMTFTSEDFKKRKKWYESAIEEAKTMAGINSKGRLVQCQLTQEGTWDKLLYEKNSEYKKRKTMTQEENNLELGKIISRATLGGSKRKTQNDTETSLPIDEVDQVLGRKPKDVSQAEELMQDLEELLTQISQSDNSTCSSALKKQESVTKLIHQKKSPDWSEMDSGVTELNNSSEDDEDCTVIDGIEFKSGTCREEITHQLKNIDTLFAELEGCF